MTVTLCTSSANTSGIDFDFWCAISPAKHVMLAPDRKLPGLTAALEIAVDEQADVWFDLAKSLGNQSCALLAHAPQCAANASDFGLILGWRHLVDGWINKKHHILVICDDPWLFRELASLGAFVIGKPPGLRLAELKLIFRGLFARTIVAKRVFIEAIRYRSGRSHFPKDASTLLVYGHPTSDSGGQDGYFGSLMKAEPRLTRILHVDCLGIRASKLVDNRRTFSLHAWGPLLKITALIFARWRPKVLHLNGSLGWLVRRSAALEGGTGQAAMIRWQQWCQHSWLKEKHPRVVTWPWENHGWERDFVQCAKTIGIQTVGYQHSTVGRREWNYAPQSSPSPMADIPDTICTSGVAGFATLKKMGYPSKILINAGALRVKSFKPLTYNPDGPIFVALPFDADISLQLLTAIRPLADTKLLFLYKDHPMTPLIFGDNPGIERTRIALEDQPGVRAVLYAATTVGLEALLGGLPTLRFQPEGLIPTDPIPYDIEIPVASRENLEEMLISLPRPSPIDPDSVFSPPDFTLWQKLLA